MRMKYPAGIVGWFWPLAPFLLCSPLEVSGQIPAPADAPRPLSPEESLHRFQIPPGFRIELVASEPLIREPSGVCWDEHGRLYVCELHGYNLEGQYDIEKLNQTGVLDRVVRRIQANPQAKEAAKAGTYGTVKLLRDTNGDGRMDQSEIFADHLPPCYGLCPARGGVIVACAPDIVFLADRDGDGRADVREILFTGFNTGALERGINAPQWGLDDWIYFGRGHTGGTITGPHLAQPVRLGGSNFRIKSDGSAIEPVTGSTYTFGHAQTEFGDRFVITTSRPGLYVTPLPWNYLARNPDVAAPGTEQDAGGYTRVFPISQPHPWRTKRAQDPGFYKYYRDRYGASDSDPGGYFTSACSPLVYQDVAFPAEYRGDYFVCEPAQNLIHHAKIEPDRSILRLRRAKGEEAREFLASSETWFHPINLKHGPDGALYIVDFYREIIEDYSAVPRYLQQQYGLTNGIQHGRVWRLTHREAPPAPSPDMSGLGPDGWVQELASPHLWRRQTARRLLTERKDRSVAPAVARLARVSKEPAAVLNALYTLEALGVLRPDDAMAALKHPSAGVRRHGLRLAERWLDTQPALLDQTLALTRETDPFLLLQVALSLGESHDPRAVSALASLARSHGDIPWMPNAILSSIQGRAGTILNILLDTPPDLGAAQSILEPLGNAIASRRDPQELSQALIGIASVPDTTLQGMCLRGLSAGLKNAPTVELSAAGREALDRLLAQKDAEVRRQAADLAGAFQITDPVQRKALIAQAARDAGDMKLPAELRLAAVTRLAVMNDDAATSALLDAWPMNTPQVRTAILDAVYARRDRLPALLDALERGSISPSGLTAFQRLTLREHESPSIRNRAVKILSPPGGADDATFRRFAAALEEKRDRAHGEQVFRDNCATCHQVRGIGFAVGPDLGAEFQRAEEAILKDILAPNDTISAGYPTYVVETAAGQTFNGILVSESATSLTLRQAAGLEQVILRKDIARLLTQTVSLMPEALAQTLQPRDAADVIAWLRNVGESGTRQPSRVELFDDDPGFLKLLTEGGGQASIETNGAFAGKACLAVTPLQRHSPRIPGWNFRIVEHPKPGEFRYLRLAWKTRGGHGVMIELAGNGRWPNAKSPRRRYFAGKNTTEWAAREVSPQAPENWRVVTVDLWKDNGSFTLTGIAPTALGGTALFDHLELLADLRFLEQADIGSEADRR
jgi:putative membrane-bound dehydrogenase-like protein